jgi:metal-responsive CopG/Arc/MetJ family transcriptional regulator
VPKIKVSVTIERSVVERVGRVPGGLSRSEIVERALKRWLHERRCVELEEEIAAYYLERKKEGSREDRDWAELGARHIAKTWK